MSEKERNRREAQREQSLEQLLYSREQVAALLGGVSIATIRRLENEERLKPIRLSHSAQPTSQTCTDQEWRSEYKVCLVKLTDKVSEGTV